MICGFFIRINETSKTFCEWINNSLSLGLSHFRLGITDQCKDTTFQDNLLHGMEAKTWSRNYLSGTTRGLLNCPLQMLICNETRKTAT